MSHFFSFCYGTEWKIYINDLRRTWYHLKLCINWLPYRYWWWWRLMMCVCVSILMVIYCKMTNPYYVPRSYDALNNHYVYIASGIIYTEIGVLRLCIPWLCDALDGHDANSCGHKSSREIDLQTVAMSYQWYILLHVWDMKKIRRRGIF